MRFGDFIDIFPDSAGRAGKAGRSGQERFLMELERFREKTAKDLEDLKAGVFAVASGNPDQIPSTVIPPNYGGPAASSKWAAFEQVGNMIAVPVGHAVRWAAGVLTLADNSSFDTAATHVVIHLLGNKAVLASVTNLAFPLALRASRGNASVGLLYLDKEGKLTDDIEDLKTSTGRLQPGVSFVQQIAVRQTAPSSGYCSGLVHVHRPGMG